MADVRSAWMEIEIERAGADLRITARGSRDERPAPHLLGPGAPLSSFAAGVRAMAARGRLLGAHLAEAKELHRALFRDGAEHLRTRLAEAAAGQPLLVRLLVRDPELQAVPWEALCDPASAMGFLGTSPDLLPVRGVTSAEPWQPGIVRGALRVLAISPQGGRGVGLLRSALAERIASGEIEWLDPIEGAAAEVRSLFQRLRREPIPHVIHFLGHGGAMDGVPALRLADADDEESWLPVELLAQQLKVTFRGLLRLVVLEACEGARPSAFASAAEILARAGADAVVAHLWPVQADVARLCSEQIYRTLAGADRRRGDIAVSLNEARRAVLGAFGGSAEAFSPVLYLRGSSGVLFDFADRKLGAAAPSLPQPPSKPGAVTPALAAGIRKPTPAPSIPAAPRKELPEAATEIEPAPLSRTPLPVSKGANRICTVLVVDLSSTAALSSRLDPGEVKEIVDGCIQKVSEEVGALGGTASRLGIDSLVGVFGAERASEIDAERAVHAALRVKDALAKMPLPRGARAFRPTARVGISTGRVFAERGEGAGVTVVGEALTAATRLQQAAPPGAIVLGRDTFRQVLARFHLEALPPVDVPGHAEPMPAYQVLGPMSFRHGLEQERFYGLDTKLVGRSSEKKRLREALEGVVEERRAALVTLVGAPGAGRSRMLAELYSSMAMDDVRFIVNAAEGSALTMSTGHGLVASLLRRRFEIPDDAAPERILHVLRRGVRWLRVHTMQRMSFDEELASLDLSPDDTFRGAGPSSRRFESQDLDDALVQLAGILDMRTSVPERGDAVRPDEKGAGARQRLIAAAATLVRFAAARRPVVILCDDAHWADDASLDVLDELVLRLEDLPLLVVCTARPELYERRPHWGEGKAAHRRIDLAPLDRKHVEEMIRDRLRHARDLSPGFVRLLADRADASPLILDETMRLLVDAGVIELREGGGEQIVHEERLGALTLPATIQGIVQARLDRLDPDARAVLERAAVVGKTFWDGAVDQLRQGGGPKTEDVISALRERQLVRSRDASTFPGERERVFTESATQEVAYETIPARVRRPMHRRVAKWLKARAPGSGEAALIALHYDRAGDLWGAAEQYTRAATYAISLGQNAEALRFLVRLREIHDESDAAGPVDFSRSAPMISWRDKVRLRLDLGDVRRRLGQLDEAEASYEQARSHIIRRDPDAPRWEARTDFRLALLLEVRGDTASARQIVERAIARAKQAGIADETPVMYAISAALLRRERRHQESWQTSLAGLRACRAIPPHDPRRRESATRTLLVLAAILAQKRRHVAAERTYLQAARLAEKIGDLESLGPAWHGVAAARAAMGQHARARATYLQSLRVKEKAGDLHQIALAYSSVAELEIEMKELPVALSHARRGVHLAEQIHARSDLAEMYRILGEAALATGKVDESLDACLRALEIAKDVGRLYLDEVVLTLARVCARAAGIPSLRPRAEEARGALQAMMTQGFLDGELRERVEISLALVGEFLS